MAYRVIINELFHDAIIAGECSKVLQIARSNSKLFKDLHRKDKTYSEYREKYCQGQNRKKRICKMPRGIRSKTDWKGHHRSWFSPVHEKFNHEELVHYFYSQGWGFGPNSEYMYGVDQGVRDLKKGKMTQKTFFDAIELSRAYWFVFQVDLAASQVFENFTAGIIFKENNDARILKVCKEQHKKINEMYKQKDFNYYDVYSEEFGISKDEYMKALCSSDERVHICKVRPLGSGPFDI